jgi:hypothetical protein
LMWFFVSACIPGVKMLVPFVQPVGGSAPIRCWWRGGLLTVGRFVVGELGRAVRALSTMPTASIVAASGWKKHT